MTLLFLLIAGLAGAVILVYEKRLKDDGIAKMQNYLMQVVNDSKLLEREKMTRIIDLFTQNNYKIEDMKKPLQIIIPPIVGVPAFCLWFCGSYPLKLSFICIFLKYGINLFANHKEKINAVTLAIIERNVM